MKNQNNKGRVISLLSKKEIPLQDTTERDTARSSFMADIEYLLLKFQNILDLNCKPLAERFAPEKKQLLDELHAIENKYADNSDMKFSQVFVEKMEQGYYKEREVRNAN